MTRHIRPERLRTLVKAALPGIVYSMETRPDGSRSLVGQTANPPRLNASDDGCEKRNS
jgi:hypothetical protein